MVAGSRSTPSSVSMITSAGDEALGQHVVHRQLEVLGVDAEGEGQAGLRVEVDQQHLLAELGEGGAERRDGRGLGDATLLVGDREGGGHGAILPETRCSSARGPWNAGRMSRPTALITGPTAGIGSCFAHAARRRRATTSSSSRVTRAGSTRWPTRCEREYGVDTEVLVADLADRDALARVEQRVADPERPVDLLVNNAGFGHKRAVPGEQRRGRAADARRAGDRGAAAQPRRPRRDGGPGQRLDHQRVQRRRLPPPRDATARPRPT